VSALASLRRRGIGCGVCIIDPLAHAERSRLLDGEPAMDAAERDAMALDLRALRQALAEHELPPHVLVPGAPLGAQIMSPSPRVGAPAR